MDVVMLWIVIVAASAGAGLVLRNRPELHLPFATLILVGVTLGFSALGNSVPAILDALGRDRAQLLNGQLWRIFTPLFVQDGGWAGTIFNIATLLILGIFAECLNGSRTFLRVYFISGLITEIVAYTLLQHQGFAGNSVAVLGLAGFLATTVTLSGPVPARVPGIIALLAGFMLLATANLHGAGFAVGALCGLLTYRQRHLSPSRVR